MVEVFTLEINLCTTEFFAQIIRIIKRRGTSNIVLKIMFKFLYKICIILVFFISFFKLGHRCYQCWCNKDASVLFEMTFVFPIQTNRFATVIAGDPHSFSSDVVVIPNA
ncbi:MAG: hypothetical protein ACI96P_001426 [Candidatus Azotimanducaceae bacterium]|jgi:hypothetical protein